MAMAILIFKREDGDAQVREFDSTEECMEGVCHLFEDHLRIKHPNVRNIIYDVDELYEFVDGMERLTCMLLQETRDKTKEIYVQMHKGWIKQTLKMLLQSQAYLNS